MVNLGKLTRHNPTGEIGILIGETLDRLTIAIITDHWFEFSAVIHPQIITPLKSQCSPINRAKDFTTSKLDPLYQPLPQITIRLSKFIRSTPKTYIKKFKNQFCYCIELWERRSYPERLDKAERVNISLLYHKEGPKIILTTTGKLLTKKYRHLDRFRRGLEIGEFNNFMELLTSQDPDFIILALTLAGSPVRELNSKAI